MQPGDFAQAPLVRRIPVKLCIQTWIVFFSGQRISNGDIAVRVSAACTRAGEQIQTIVIIVMRSSFLKLTIESRIYIQGVHITRGVHIVKSKCG